MRTLLLALSLLVAPTLAGCLDLAEPLTAGSEEETPAPAEYRPHVLVAVPDSGINPYHETYYRPENTAHPCTYVEDFPCDIPALNLTLGTDDYDAAFEADRATWESVEPGQWYWIPQTVFVAVSCEEPFDGPFDPAFDAAFGTGENLCILDDNGMHGTGTTSSILSENPDALIAFREGGPSEVPFIEAGFPVDIFSVSWGYIAPLPVPVAVGEQIGFSWEAPPLYVKAAGNDPRSSLMDAWAGDPRLIVVGGAYAESDSEEGMATKQPDVVSYYCRPTAQTKATHEMRESYCGTSFAAPTVAGALSKVVLGLREESGYTGSIDGDLVDPVLNVTVNDLRGAMNRTASYDPEPQYDNARITGVPLNPAAPWAQWGWGFYDGLVADATLAFLLGEADVPEKPALAHAYMDAMHSGKKALYEP